MKFWHQSKGAECGFTVGFQGISDGLFAVWVPAKGITSSNGWKSTIKDGHCFFLKLVRNGFAARQALAELWQVDFFAIETDYTFSVTNMRQARDCTTYHHGDVFVHCHGSWMAGTQQSPILTPDGPQLVHFNPLGVEVHDDPFGVARTVLQEYVDLGVGKGIQCVRSETGASLRLIDMATTQVVCWLVSSGKMWQFPVRRVIAPREPITAPDPLIVYQCHEETQSQLVETVAKTLRDLLAKSPFDVTQVPSEQGEYLNRRPHLVPEGLELVEVQPWVSSFRHKRWVIVEVKQKIATPSCYAGVLIGTNGERSHELTTKYGFPEQIQIIKSVAVAG